ncbi:MAG: beta-galactosidase [Acidobacteriaceae bacterium]
MPKVLCQICVLLAVALADTVGHAETPAPASAPREAKLTELTGKLRIGAEFFLNRTDTKASVEKQFQLMHATGLTLVRIFIIWDDVERIPGVWDFSHYDWIYGAAAKNGIQIAATLCPEDPPGWTGKTPFYHSRVNLDDPANRLAAAVYLRKVVGRYRDNPAQGVWLLMNEPAKYDTDPATFHAFGNWLQVKYGTVTNLDRVWFHSLKQFSDATITQQQLENYWTDYNAVIDWRNFNVDNLIEELNWVKEQVLAIDPNHPVHFNVTRPIGDAEGQDAWKEKKVQDIVGVSMHWTMKATTPEHDYGELYAYRLDLVAGASVARPRKPLWVTELQSGPAAFTGRFAFTETPGDLTRWMWDSYGAGSRAVIFWLWSPRNIGTEGGEWGLVGLDGNPSVRVPAVKAIAETLERNQWLNQAYAQPAKVAILYNREAQVLISLDGRSQHRQDEVQKSLLGCYLALHRAHVPTDFVDLDQLKSDELQKYDVLYIPYSYALDNQAIAALKKYVSDGGTLWADGLTGWKNATGKVRATIPGGMTDLFGVEASDLYPMQPDDPYSVALQNEQGGELWKLPLELKGADVVLRTKDGQPFEVKHVFGKGHVFYFESAVTLAYAMRFNPIVQQWIVGPAVAATSGEDVSLAKGSREIMFRGMVQPTGFAAVLSNWGGAQKAVVSFKGHYTVADVITGEIVPVTEANGRTLATVNMQAGAVAVFRAAKSN